ncbi:MAG: hypothetical protein ACRCSL_16670 [Microbacterium sp.]
MNTRDDEHEARMYLHREASNGTPRRVGQQHVAALLRKIEVMREITENHRAELDRLRRLPVISTCSACAWHRITHVFGDRVDYCGHLSAHKGDVGAASAPPDWCPLRGGER